MLNGSLSHFIHQYVWISSTIPIIENPYMAMHVWHLCFDFHLINSSRPICILWVRIVYGNYIYEYTHVHARVYMCKHSITQLFIWMPTWLSLFIYCCVDTSINQLTNLKITYVPDPPELNKNVTIYFSGYLSKTIYVNMSMSPAI